MAGPRSGGMPNEVLVPFTMTGTLATIFRP
jgi:hypothetical protein